ncbi:hypothetical protein DRJ54_01820 [Candidatus Acetothermia bacterium]|nr:MAG: hypothetical protein DRJ54_01820 [Candidatus Acetothermia bacterium]
MRKVCLMLVVLGMALVAFAQEPVAIVNGEEISRQRLDQATGLSSLLFTIYQQFPRFAQTLLTTEEGKALIQRYQRDVLEQLILKTLELQEAESRSIEPDQAQLEARVEETLTMILQQNDLTEEELVDILARQGRTLEDFRGQIAAQVREQLTIELLRNQVTASATVTEDEIQAYYREHPDRFQDESGAIKPLEEVHDDIAALILDQKRSQIWNAWLEELRAEADVQVLIGQEADQG